MRRQARDRLLRRIPRDRVSVALAALLGVGLALRVYFFFVWRPAITGYSDSAVYFQDAVESLWKDPVRTVGYSMFLRVLHGISPHLILVPIVQHALGLISAVLLFLTVRRCGGPRWLGLVPAGIIALGGDELFLEHAALSEALFIFLLSATLYSAVRASQGRAWWAALAGLCAGLGVWDRGAGIPMVAVVALWLVFSAGRPTRRTIAVGVLSLVVSLRASASTSSGATPPAVSPASRRTAAGISMAESPRGRTARSSRHRRTPCSCAKFSRHHSGSTAPTRRTSTAVYLRPCNCWGPPTRSPSIPTRWPS